MGACFSESENIARINSVEQADHDEIPSNIDIIDDLNHNESTATPIKHDKITDYTAAVINIYVGLIQKEITNKYDETLYASFSIIPKSINNMIIDFYPTLKIYGRGQNLKMNDNEICSKWKRLEIFESILYDTDQIFVGKGKYFIKHFKNIVYGIGSKHENIFFSNDINNKSENKCFSNLEAIDISSYFVDDRDDNKSYIKLISNGVYGNSVILLENGSIYHHNSNYSKSSTKCKLNKIDNYSLLNDKIEIVSIECGLNHSLLLSINGFVYSLGENNEGQCGVYKKGMILKPTLITTFIDKECFIKTISCGQHHSVCLDINDNKQWVFGCNTNQQCCSSYNKLYESLPKIPNKLKNVNVLKVKCGEFCVVYIDDNNYCYLYGLLHGGDKTLRIVTDKIQFRDFDICLDEIMLISKDNKIYCCKKNGVVKLIGNKNFKDITLHSYVSAVVCGDKNSFIIFNT